MPLFIRNRLLYIHIPKCGGDTISHFLRQHDDPPFLFIPDGSVLVNGHTPQHLTWKEYLKLGWSPNNHFKVAALVRHPIDRVISEFRYIHNHRPDLLKIAATRSSFLDAFLTKELSSTTVFDNHNLSILEFLENESGQIDPIIDIRPVQEMNQFMDSLCIPPVPASARRNVTNRPEGHDLKLTFLPEDIDRIVAFYARDIEWFKLQFPHIQSELIT
jgi:hypothetical protein